MKQKIELFLFDLGGVLIELGDSPLPDSTINISEWFSSSTAKKFERGLISRHDFAKEFKHHLCIDKTVDQIIEHFAKLPKGFYPGAIKLIEDLSLNYRVAALSNTNEIHFSIINEEFGVKNLFEKIIASHIFGMAKPDKSIYLHALAELNIEQPRSVVFIDDNESNVLAARELGINSYLAKGFVETANLVKSLL